MANLMDDKPEISNATKERFCHKGQLLNLHILSVSLGPAFLTEDERAGCAALWKRVRVVPFSPNDATSDLQHNA